MLKHCINHPFIFIVYGITFTRKKGPGISYKKICIMVWRNIHYLIQPIRDDVVCMVFGVHTWHPWPCCCIAVLLSKARWSNFWRAGPTSQLHASPYTTDDLFMANSWSDLGIFWLAQAERSLIEQSIWRESYARVIWEIVLPIRSLVWPSIKRIMSKIAGSISQLGLLLHTANRCGYAAVSRFCEA